MVSRKSEAPLPTPAKHRMTNTKVRGSTREGKRLSLLEVWSSISAGDAQAAPRLIVLFVSSLHVFLMLQVGRNRKRHDPQTLRGEAPRGSEGRAEGRYALQHVVTSFWASRDVSL